MAGDMLNQFHAISQRLLVPRVCVGQPLMTVSAYCAYRVAKYEELIRL